jgi:hypothetical protein
LPTIRNGAAWTELKLAIARNVTPLNDERNERFGCMTVFPSLLTDIFLLTSSMIIGLSALVGNPGLTR